jgi:hypothetical protein
MRLMTGFSSRETSGGVLRIEIGADVLQRVLESPDRKSSLSSDVGSYRSTINKGEERI